MRILCKRGAWLAAAILAGLLVLAPLPAWSGPWLHFEGVVDGVDEFGAGVSPVAVGEEIVGSISLIHWFEAVDGEVDPQLGVYDDFARGGLVRLLGSGGAVELRFKTKGPTDRITIDDGFTSPGEDALGYAYVGDASFLGVRELDLQGTDPSAMAWDDDTLFGDPATLLHPFWYSDLGFAGTFFEDATLTFLVFSGPADGFGIEATVEIVSVVPEPSAVVLLATSLVALAWRVGRRT